MRNKKRRMLQRLRQMVEVTPAPAEPAQTYDEPAVEAAAKARIKSRKRKSIKEEDVKEVKAKEEK